MGTGKRKAWCRIRGLMGVAMVVCCSSSTSQDGGSTSINDSGVGGADGAYSGDATLASACRLDPNAVCNASTIGFVCPRSISPEASQTSSCPLIGNITPTEITACCVLSASASTCTSTGQGSCSGTETGYSCRGSDTPAQANSNFVCRKGPSTGGASTYCCSEYHGTSCQLYPSLSGCGTLYPLRCAGATPPSSADSMLVCDKGTSSVNDTWLYCCSF